ncbi:hypothetical protein ACFL0W_01830 [Nanoarchaeota archaeon]
MANKLISRVFIIAVFILIFLATVISANAADVAVILEMNDGKVYTDCVDVSNDAKAKNAISKFASNLGNVSISFNGSSISSINGVDSGSSNAWGVFYADDDLEKFETRNGDINTEEVEDSDILGISYTTFSGSTPNTPPSFKSFVDVCKHIKFDDLDVKSTDQDNNDDEVKPYEVVEIEVTFENPLSETDVEGGELTIQFEDESGKELKDDNGNEIEYTGDIIIDADDKTTITFNFTMPVDIDRNEEYDMIIEIKDAESSATDDEFDFDLTKENVFKVKRETDDVIIYETKISKTELECDRDFTFFYDIKNIGTSDQDDINVSVRIVDIIGEKTEFSDIFSLDDDPDKTFEFSKTYNFELPDDIEQGQYDVRLRMDYDNNKLHITKSHLITAIDCAGGDQQSDQGSDSSDQDSNQDSGDADDGSDDGSDDPNDSGSADSTTNTGSGTSADDQNQDSQSSQQQNTGTSSSVITKNYIPPKKSDGFGIGTIVILVILEVLLIIGVVLAVYWVITKRKDF